MSHLPDLHWGPSLYESAALLAELRWQNTTISLPKNAFFTTHFLIHGAGYGNRTRVSTLGRSRIATIRIPQN